MRKALNDAFGDSLLPCLAETNDTQIEVFDCYNCTPAAQRSYIKNNADQPVHFTLENPGAANLIFAALDNCLLGPADPARCDFLIGNFKKLYFVEIKQVNTAGRSTARAVAIQQLDTSIEFLKRNIPLTDTSLVAVICLKAKKAYPLQSAKRAADMVAFKEKHNADLMEGQNHTF